MALDDEKIQRAATRCRKLAQGIAQVARDAAYGHMPYTDFNPDVIAFVEAWRKAPLTFHESEAVTLAMAGIIREELA